LRLLSLPEVGGWYMRRFYKPFQNISVALRPLVEPIFKPIAGFSLPDKEVMDAPYEFYEQIEALEKVLTDNTQTSVRLVTNPEKMVIKESLRALSLRKYKIHSSNAGNKIRKNTVKKFMKISILYQ